MKRFTTKISALVYQTEGAYLLLFISVIARTLWQNLNQILNVSSI